LLLETPKASNTKLIMKVINGDELNIDMVKILKMIHFDEMGNQQART
jgi:hypothetical protein